MAHPSTCCSTAALILRTTLLLLLASPSYLLSQNGPPPSDPQALSLVSQSMAALTSGIAIADVTLGGNANWIVGSNIDNGLVTLLAKGTGESRIDLNLIGGPRTEIRNDSAGFPQGESIAAGGIVSPWALHNCWINASWFFPALSFLATASDPSLVFVYVGLENRGNGSVQHISVYRYLGGQKPDVISITQTVSTEDIYLDSSSLLPVAFAFNTHPDSDALTNIPVEIDFSNYVLVNGVQVPFRVQKSVAGALTLDIAVTNAVVNSGLSDTPFAIQ